MNTTKVNGLLEHMLRLKFGTKKVHFIDCNDRYFGRQYFGVCLYAPLLLGFVRTASSFTGVNNTAACL